ncbi:hypothetical protein A2U01_0098195, partial [Trifolium medium]|nr:hypothetical protein [Trifolium medium]
VREDRQGQWRDWGTGGAAAIERGRSRTDGAAASERERRTVVADVKNALEEEEEEEEETRATLFF